MTEQLTNTFIFVIMFGFIAIALVLLFIADWVIGLFWLYVLIVVLKQSIKRCEKR